MKVNNIDAAVNSVQRVAADGTNDSIRITFNAPAQTKPGTYNVAISIPNYAHTSTAKLSYDTPGITIGNNTYKYMQDMTSSICSQWDGGLSGTANWDSTNNRPKAFTTSTQKPNYVYGTTPTSEPLDGGSAVSSTITDSVVAANPTAYWDYRRTVRINNINAEVPEAYLQDNRDGNYYRIRKMADGNCWMTENLRLVFDRDGVNSVGKVDASGNVVTQSPVVAINENNSNVGANAVGGSAKSNFNSSTFASALLYSETSNNSSNWFTATDGHSGSAGSYTARQVSLMYSRSFYSAEVIDTCELGLNDVARGASTNYTSMCFVAEGDEQVKGAFYNWRAATAGTGAYGTVATNDGILTDSICPKGWQLPSTSSSGKSFTTLIGTTYGGGLYSSTNQYGAYYQSARVDASSANLGLYHSWAGTAMAQMKPLSFAQAGFWYQDYLAANEGAYTTAQGNGSTFAMLGAEITAGYYHIGNPAEDRSLGFSIRCVAQ